MPPAVIIFGCGYVGTAVAQLARHAGHPVFALTRNAAKASELAALGIAVVQGDLAGDAWHSALDPAGAWVVNCVSSGGGGVAGYEQSYLRGMRSLAEWSRRHGEPAATVYTSSTSVYPQDGDVEVDESAEAEPTAEGPQILRATERLLLEEVARLGRRRYVLRLAGIYGPGRHHILDQLRAGAGEVAGAPETWLNLIHRDDAASAIWACLNRAEPAGRRVIFNVSDGQPARRREVVQWLAEQLGGAPPRFTGVPAQGRRQITPNRRIVARRIRAELGWAPQYSDFRAGYAQLLGA